jgi:hypothetical protein
VFLLEKRIQVGEHDEMTRFGLWTTILLATACCAPAALADAITTYNINFTTSLGDSPSAGSFTYDSTTQSFSDFTVTWEGLLFTLTGAANDPSTLGPPCSGGQTGAAASFALLDGTCSPNTEWFVGPQPTTLTPEFTFASESGSIAIFNFNPSDFPPGSGESSGGWTITAVPEPESAVLLATLLCAGAFLLRKRIVKGPCQAK